MATLHGPLKISGKLGGLVFTRNGQVRFSSSLSRNRIKTAPEFARTRDQNQEFGSATKGNKLLRSAFYPLLQPFSGRLFMGRLTRQLLQCIQTDPVNRRGMRTLNNGDFKNLKGFEFSESVYFNSVLNAPYESGINSAEGRLWTRIPSFIPGRDIKAISAASHFKIFSAAAEIDFDKETYDISTKDSGFIALNRKPTPELQFSHMLTAFPEGVLFLVLGIQFFSEEGEEMLPYSSRAALKIVETCNE
jgi:hypothetical protein